MLRSWVSVRSAATCCGGIRNFSSSRSFWVIVDYIIVGAGTAGCVLADKLSANGRNQVLLVEAGSKPRNPFIKIPAGFAKAESTRTGPALDRGRLGNAATCPRPPQCCGRDDRLTRSRIHRQRSMKKNFQIGIVTAELPIWFLPMTVPRPVRRSSPVVF
jgi:hypothetical protein